MSKTHFGFRMVEKAVKESMGTFSNTVGQVFRNVASNYDVMNDLMSVGVHRLWKSEFIKQLDPGPNTKLLDVAGGTGDVALMFLDHLKQRSYPGSVTVVDINPAMLEIGQKKAQGLANIDFMLGNAESLDLPSESVDAYTIAFGIRNCTNIDNVIKEAFRVLKRGGKFQCLEFSHVPKPLEGYLCFYVAFMTFTRLTLYHPLAIW
jgi:2-methoxy-6-polyprenyl-1,4-benzoquinol methylase